MLQSFLFYCRISILTALCLTVPVSCSSPTGTDQRVNPFNWQITYLDASTESYHWSAPGGDVFGAWVSDSTTTLQLVGGTSGAQWSVMLFIPGTTVGKYVWNSAAIIPDVQIDEDINSYDYFFSDSGYTEITALGEPGERVLGNFKGRFYRRSDLFGAPLWIEGTFDFIRLASRQTIEL